jgi:hypothetical protein
MTATVNVSSADPTVAAVLAAPLGFTGGQHSAQFEIDPLAVGSTVVSVEPVTGFDTPALLEREVLVIVNP